MIGTYFYSYCSQALQTFGIEPKRGLTTFGASIATAAAIKLMCPRTLFEKIITAGTAAGLAALLIDKVCFPPAKEAKIQSENVERAKTKRDEAFYKIGELFYQLNQNVNAGKHGEIDKTLTELRELLNSEDFNSIDAIHFSLTNKKPTTTN